MLLVGNKLVYNINILKLQLASILFIPVLDTGRYHWPRGLKAWVCDGSFAGILGSNPAGGMDVCLLRVLCVVR